MNIKDNIYMLEGTKGSHVYLILDAEPVLIDAGFPHRGRALLRRLKAMGVEPDSIRHILITHHDLDHVGGLALLEERTGASVWASATDIPYITGEKPRPGFKKTLSRIMCVKTPKHINALSEGQTVAGVGAVYPPGHTPGHVCLLYGGVLFAGDLVENKKGAVTPYPAPWTIDPEALLESIKKVEGLEFELVCPAHGQPYRRSGKAICNS